MTIEQTNVDGYARRELGSLKPCTEFVTCLTRREGYTLDRSREYAHSGGVEVELGGIVRILHPCVVVLVKA